MKQTVAVMAIILALLLWFPANMPSSKANSHAKLFPYDVEICVKDFPRNFQTIILTRPHIIKRSGPDVHQVGRAVYSLALQT